MAMHSFIESSKDDSKTSVCLRNYQRHEPNSSAEGNINHFIKDLKSFDYKTSSTGKLETNSVE